jgi:hypothetical protein
MKGHGKNDDSSLQQSKNVPSKFIASKVRSAHNNLSNQSNHILLGPGQAGAVSTVTPDMSGNTPLLSEKDIQARNPQCPRICKLFMLKTCYAHNLVRLKWMLRLLKSFATSFQKNEI